MQSGMTTKWLEHPAEQKQKGLMWSFGNIKREGDEWKLTLKFSYGWYCSQIPQQEAIN